MALVILPCDLPHWHGLRKELIRLSEATDAKQLADGMLKIHNMCNTGLDPDEPERTDPHIFRKLESFLESLPGEEGKAFFETTLPVMAKRASDLKELKPKNGFHFSLQQQADKREYPRSFLASLLAHSFFSTFPRRTPKTHPTLQDANFTHFFKHLDQSSQQAKLRSIFHYFDVTRDCDPEQDDLVSFSRQVMSGRQWLTIEDWLDSRIPLCPITVRNERRIEEAEPRCLRVCFSSSRIGGAVLREGSSQECTEFCAVPELLSALVSIEALEDNEVLIVKDAYQVARIVSPRENASVEKLEKPNKVCVCCMDPENYTRLPLSQLEEDNLLRELNKALLGFRQGITVPAQKPTLKTIAGAGVLQRRLSPIGESFGSSPSERVPLNEENSSEAVVSPTSGKQVWLEPSGPARHSENFARRGKFIVLGSSGECLPVNRTQTFTAGKREVMSSREIFAVERSISNRDSMYSSARSEDSRNKADDEDDDDDDDEVFHSARTSVDKEEFSKDSSKSDEGYPKPNTVDVNSFSTDDERRCSFAERLREALLRGATTYSSDSEDSSYAVGISVTGSSAEQNHIRCRRGTSTGFLLQDESLDVGLYRDTENDDLNESDRYSFATDDSEAMEIFDQLSQWVSAAGESPVEEKRETVLSDLKSCLMKRALSDSCAVKGESDIGSEKVRSAARSLSLELVKQNPKLAAQLISMLSEKDATLKVMLPNKYGQRPVATGNWGCGSCYGGDAQIKLAIQWLAASFTGLPNLIYYTCRHRKLVKLDTVKRVLIDRGWTVGQLATLLLQYAQMSLRDSHPSATLFDLLITTVHT